MKKLVLQMQMSVDGFVESAGRNSWQIWDWGNDCPWDAELKDDFNAFFSATDTILLSRKMAEQGYLNHWASAAKKLPEDSFYAFAQKITAVPKIVLSSKLENSRWEGTRVGSGDLPREVRSLKQGIGGNIAVFGGVGFASALIAADLVDEYQFFVNPAALGSGRGVFAQSDFRRLRLLGSKSYECGIVVNRYAPAT